MRQRTISLWMNTEVAPDGYYMPSITSNRSKLADFNAHNAT